MAEVILPRAIYQGITVLCFVMGLVDGAIVGWGFGAGVLSGMEALAYVLFFCGMFALGLWRKK